MHLIIGIPTGGDSTFRSNKKRLSRDTLLKVRDLDGTHVFSEGMEEELCRTNHSEGLPRNRIHKVWQGSI